LEQIIDSDIPLLHRVEITEFVIKRWGDHRWKLSDEFIEKAPEINPTGFKKRPTRSVSQLTH
jgi:hypothetical protein